MPEQLYWIIFSIPSILIASAIHEFSHAWAAYKLGDLTAKAEGRLTLNPLAHIDPIGALMMVIAHFGWSKPVPINEYNFRNPITGTAITAFAGPLSNMLTAVISAVLLRLVIPGNPLTQTTTVGMVVSAALLTFIIINLSLAIFNLIPFPPLDGHKIVRAFLPNSLRYYWEKLENIGPWILILFLLPFSPVAGFIGSFLSGAISFILAILLRF